MVIKYLFELVETANFGTFVKNSLKFCLNYGKPGAQGHHDHMDF